MSHIRFSRIVLFLGFAASLLLLPASAAAQRGHFRGGFYGPAFPFYGGFYYGPYGYPFGFYGYPYGPYGYYYGRPLGEVHVKSPDSNAQIFINGAFAGRAHDLKRFYLVPGTYDVEQHIGNDVQKQHVFVIADRNLKIDFGPAPAASPQPAPAPAGNAPAPPAPAPAAPPEPQQS